MVGNLRFLLNWRIGWCAQDSQVCASPKPTTPTPVAKFIALTNVLDHEPHFVLGSNTRTKLKHVLIINDFMKAKSDIIIIAIIISRLSMKENRFKQFCRRLIEFTDTEPTKHY